MLPFRLDDLKLHLPIATLVLIAANAAVFVAMALADESVMSNTRESHEQWCLVYGRGLNPRQWCTAMFLHLATWRLVGNMFFLFTFGLIVEGKVGWWKFAVFYLLIGVAQAAAEQTIMLASSYDPTSTYNYSSTGAIFGVMAMALVFVPTRDVQCLVPLPPWIAQISVSAFAILFLAWQLMLFTVSDLTTVTILLPAIGAVLGFVIGVVMVKARRVDCEGWDMFSVLDGRAGVDVDRELRIVENKQAAQVQRRELELQRHDEAQLQLRAFVDAGNPMAAMNRLDKLQATGDSVDLEPDLLLSIIKGCHAAGQPARALPLMVTYVRRFPESAAAMRVLLARVLIEHENRPTKALSVLQKIEPGSLPPKLDSERRALEAIALERQDQGELELDEEDW